MKDGSIELGQQVRPTADTLHRGLDGELVLLNVNSGNYYSLDEVGTAMWAALCSRPSIGEALAVVGAAYDISTAELERDFLRLVGELRDEGLVELSPP